MSLETAPTCLVSKHSLALPHHVRPSMEASPAEAGHTNGPGRPQQGISARPNNKCLKCSDRRRRRQRKPPTCQSTPAPYKQRQQPASPVEMAPPAKRALFSLNLESQSESLYSRVDDKNRPGDDRVKVLESSGPTTGSTHLEFVTKPFEKLVDRTVEGVVEGTGKKLDSVEGDIEGDVETSSRGEHSGQAAGSGARWTVTKDSGTTRTRTRHVDNRSSASKKNKIWEDYDTSEL